MSEKKPSAKLSPAETRDLAIGKFFLCLADLVTEVTNAVASTYSPKVSTDVKFSVQKTNKAKY